MKLFMTVNNLFDNQPPIIAGSAPGSRYPTISSLYDIFGRSFTVGAKLKF